MLSIGCRQCCAGPFCRAVSLPRASAPVIAVSSDLVSCRLESAVSAVSGIVGCLMLDSSEVVVFAGARGSVLHVREFKSRGGGSEGCAKGCVNGSGVWYRADAGLVG